MTENKTYHIDLVSRYGGDVIEAIYMVEASDEEDALAKFKDEPASRDWYVKNVVEVTKI